MFFISKQKKRFCNNFIFLLNFPRNLSENTIFVDPMTNTCVFTDFSKAKEIYCVNKVDEKFDGSNWGSSIDASDSFSALSFFESNTTVLSSIMTVWGMNFEYFDVQVSCSYFEFHFTLKRLFLFFDFLCFFLCF